MSHQAILNGQLTNDGGEPCAVWFEWGKTILYGNTTPLQSVTTGQTFLQLITGLDPGTVYHFRAIANNSAGTINSVDMQFTTPGAPIVAPTTQTLPPVSVGLSQSQLNGLLLSDGGEICDCGFEWGTVLVLPLQFTTSFQPGQTGQTFGFMLNGLYPSTTYYYRAVVRNSVATAYGAVLSFQTRPGINKAHALSREEL